MLSSIHLKIPGRLESFLADFAGKLALAVDILPVTVHAARAAESLATIHAGVRELARVLSHVNLQSILVDEPGNEKMKNPTDL